MFKSLANVARLASTCLLAGSTSGAKHTTDPIDVVRNNITQKKAVLLDVREQGEWARGHLKSAILIPLTELSRNPESATGDLQKKKIVYAYCASGHRCLIAARYLHELGFDVRPLRAGFRQLADAGFPTESGR